MSAKTTRKDSTKPAPASPPVGKRAEDAAASSAPMMKRAEDATASSARMEGTAAKPRAPRQSAAAKAPAAKAAQPAQRGEHDGRVRAVIDRVIPEVDCGRFAVKRVVGDTMDVEAHVFTDGHDAIRCVLRHRHESEADWRETPMTLK